MMYSICERKTGQILMTVNYPEDIRVVQERFPDNNVISGEFSEKYFVVAGEPELRPDSPCSISRSKITADTIDTVVIRNIPVNSLARISGTGVAFQRYTVNDGQIKFSTSKKGRHSIKIVCFPFLEKEFLIHAY